MGNIPRDLILKPLEGEEGNMRLCDLVDSSGEWNLEHIADLIPNEVKQCISRMNPPRTDDSVDTVAWTLTSDGMFSNVSAYESLLDPSLNANYNLYKIIWKWIGPERSRVHLWKCSQEASLTNEVSWHRGLANSSLCPICSSEDE